MRHDEASFPFVAEETNECQLCDGTKIGAGCRAKNYDIPKYVEIRTGIHLVWIATDI